jgi:hypothetical protein
MIFKINHDQEPTVLDISNEAHHSLPGLSSSQVVQIAEPNTPAHFYRNVVEAPEQKETPAMRLGTMVHMAVLEPELFEQTYRVLPEFGDMRSSKNRQARDEYLEDNQGFVFATADEFDAAQKCKQAVEKNNQAVEVLAHASKHGMIEKSIQFKWESCGLLCKARPDLFVGGTLLDVKTTRDISPRTFTKELINSNYHTRLAFYAHAIEQLGHSVDAFSFLAIENKEPYLAVVYNLDEFLVEQAKLRVEKFMLQIFDCYAKNQWPGHENQTLTIPNWASLID